MTALVILGIYLGLLVLIGALAGRLSRGTSADFQLASHSIGPVLLLMSLFGTTMTAFALVGSTAEAYRRGSAVYGLLAASTSLAPAFGRGADSMATARRSNSSGTGSRVDSSRPCSFRCSWGSSCPTCWWACSAVGKWRAR